LPRLTGGQRCPADRGRSFDNGQFGGIALGTGVVRPLISTQGGRQRAGVIPFKHTRNGKWWQVKTLWFAFPRYRGPALIRGRRLDGNDRIAFGERPSLIDPQLPAGPTLNGTGGWREWPGATFIRHLGCYAWQVDGRGFSTVIVFKAVRSR
jgi:hypothetical protein